MWDEFESSARLLPSAPEKKEPEPSAKDENALAAADDKPADDKVADDKKEKPVEPVAVIEEKPAEPVVVIEEKAATPVASTEEVVVATPKTTEEVAPAPVEDEDEPVVALWNHDRDQATFPFHEEPQATFAFNGHQAEEENAVTEPKNETEVTVAEDQVQMSPSTDIADSKQAEKVAAPQETTIEAPVPAGEEKSQAAAVSYEQSAEIVAGAQSLVTMAEDEDSDKPATIDERLRISAVSSDDKVEIAVQACEPNHAEVAEKESATASRIVDREIEEVVAALGGKPETTADADPPKTAAVAQEKREKIVTAEGGEKTTSAKPVDVDEAKGTPTRDRKKALASRDVNTAERPFRVKLRGSVLVLVRLPNKRSVRGAFHQLSTSGGVIHLEKPLDEKLEVELIFHIQEKTIRNKAQMLFPMWATQGWMQPFRFIDLAEKSRDILDNSLKSFLSDGAKGATAGA